MSLLFHSIFLRTSPGKHRWKNKSMIRDYRRAAVRAAIPKSKPMYLRTSTYAYLSAITRYYIRLRFLLLLGKLRAYQMNQLGTFERTRLVRTVFSFARNGFQFFRRHLRRGSRRLARRISRYPTRSPRVLENQQRVTLQPRRELLPAPSEAAMKCCVTDRSTGEKKTQ